MPRALHSWGRRGRNGLCRVGNAGLEMQGWKCRVGNSVVSVSAVVAWRKPRQGSDPDVLGCLQAQDAGGFSVGMACNKWIRKNQQNRKQEEKMH